MKIEDFDIGDRLKHTKFPELGIGRVLSFVGVEGGNTFKAILVEWENKGRNTHDGLSLSACIDKNFNKMYITKNGKGTRRYYGGTTNDPIEDLIKIDTIRIKVTFKLPKTDENDRI